MSELPEKYLQIAADAMPEGATFQETCRVDRAILAAVEEEREGCAQLAIAETKAPAQRNAKDQWVEQIGQRLCHAIRNRSVTDKG